MISKSHQRRRKGFRKQYFSHEKEQLCCRHCAWNLEISSKNC
ncbi:unnamed protein product [Notodromas monacha]|uniref:Uncharacterized protein n=1 Tax=Notodromas monacha TaxID=399045 RepID=A0A7R9C3G2_9CRUS|nr:unnamed protein product [Notodromas monacha]CAG0925598.1 unnamed protein product [Notodromas monacha]